MEKFKKRLAPVAIVTAIAVMIFFILHTGLQHIEDTNGSDNIKLTTITDADIIDMKMGARNPCTVRSALIGSGVEFSSDRFTGVYEILYANYILPSDMELDINTLHVSEGNFRMVVVHDGKIVAEVYPDSEEMITTIRLENITGYVSLRIAGESAAYSFQMTSTDYDMFSHPDGE